MVTPVKPPMRKSVTPFSASGASVTTASIPALNRLEMATPASTTVIRAAPVARARIIIRPTPASAPAKAASGAYCWAAGAMAHSSATASPAPEFTPMMPGEARGLFSTVWITAPDTARAAPASMAAQVRGRRVYRTIRAAAEAVSAPVRASSTARGDNSTDPASRLTAPAHTVSRHSAVQNAALPRRVEYIRQLLIGFPPSRVRFQVV